MSKYGVVGNNQGIDLPQSQVPQEQLVEEKKMAKYSKSEEYQRLEGYLKERIKFWQKYLPDGRDLSNAHESAEVLGAKWQIANGVIREIEAILTSYEQAREVVEDDVQSKGA